MAQGRTVGLCGLKFMVAPVPPIPTLKMFLVLFLPATPLTRGDATPPLRLPAKRTGKAELLPARKRCLLGCVGGTFLPLLSFPLKTNTKPAVSSAEGDGSQLHLNYPYYENELRLGQL